MTYSMSRRIFVPVWLLGLVETAENGFISFTQCIVFFNFCESSCINGLFYIYCHYYIVMKLILNMQILTHALMSLENS